MYRSSAYAIKDVGKPVFAGQVGKYETSTSYILINKFMWNISYRVIETKNAGYAVGDLVTGNFGWVTLTICKAEDLTSVRKLDSNLPVSPSTALGILGMTGYMNRIAIRVACDLFSILFSVLQLILVFSM